MGLCSACVPPHPPAPTSNSILSSSQALNLHLAYLPPPTSTMSSCLRTPYSCLLSLLMLLHHSHFWKIFPDLSSPNPHPHSSSQWHQGHVKSPSSGLTEHTWLSQLQCFSFCFAIICTHFYLSKKVWAPRRQDLPGVFPDTQQEINKYLLNCLSHYNKSMSFFINKSKIRE